MKYKFVILFIAFLLIPVFVSAAQSTTPYSFNLIPSPTFNNNTAFVNASSNWITDSLGPLSDVNTTQFFSSSAVLNINQSWGSTVWCELTGCNITGAITTGLATVTNLIDSGLTASLGVYTDGSKQLTSTPPTSGVLGYWTRSGTTISTATAGDSITTTGLGTFGKVVVDSITLDGSTISTSGDMALVAGGANPKTTINSELIVNSGHFASDGLRLFGHTGVSTTGSRIFLYNSGSETVDGFIFMNQNNEWVFKNTAQSSDTDQGNFAIDVDDGTVEMQNDLRIDADSNGLILGEGQDASIKYDGNDLIINPQVVGSGGTKFNGMMGLGDEPVTANTFIRSGFDHTATVGNPAGLVMFQDIENTATSSMDFIGIQSNLRFNQGGGGGDNTGSLASTESQFRTLFTSSADIANARVTVSTFLGDNDYTGTIDNFELFYSRPVTDGTIGTALTVTNLTGLHITEISASAIATAWGIKVEDITTTNAFAIQTGLGEVNIGDNINITNNSIVGIFSLNFSNGDSITGNNSIDLVVDGVTTGIFGNNIIELMGSRIRFGNRTVAGADAEIFLQGTPNVDGRWTFKTDNVAVTELSLESETIIIDATKNGGTPTVKILADSHQYKWKETSRSWLDSNFATQVTRFGEHMIFEQEPYVVEFSSNATDEPVLQIHGFNKSMILDGSMIVNNIDAPSAVNNSIVLFASGDDPRVILPNGQNKRFVLAGPGSYIIGEPVTLLNLTTMNDTLNINGGNITLNGNLAIWTNGTCNFFVSPNGLNSFEMCN